MEIKHEVRLPLTKAEAWDVLTASEHVAAWWGDHVRLAARVGGELREVWRNGDRDVVTTGTVVRHEAPELLELTWADDDWDGETIVTFRVAEDRDGSIVSVQHRGWEALPAEGRAQLVRAHEAGWGEIIRRLESYASRLRPRGDARKSGH